MMYGAASVGAAKNTGLPQVVGVSSYGSGSTLLTSHVIAAPNGEIGDILVFLGHNAYFSQIPGWTQYNKASGEGSIWDYTVQTKVATTTSENITYAPGGDSYLNAFVVRLRNVDSYASALIQASDLGSGLLTVTAPSGKGFYLYLGFISTNWGIVTEAPSGYTGLQSISFVDPGPRPISLMHRLTPSNSSPDVPGVVVTNPWGSRGIHLCFYKN